MHFRGCGGRACVSYVGTQTNCLPAPAIQVSTCERPRKASAVTASTRFATVVPMGSNCCAPPLRSEINSLQHCGKGRCHLVCVCPGSAYSRPVNNPRPMYDCLGCVAPVLSPVPHHAGEEEAFGEALSQTQRTAETLGPSRYSVRISHSTSMAGAGFLRQK